MQTDSTLLPIDPQWIFPNGGDNASNGFRLVHANIGWWARMRKVGGIKKVRPSTAFKPLVKANKSKYDLLFEALHPQWINNAFSLKWELFGAKAIDPKDWGLIEIIDEPYVKRVMIGGPVCYVRDTRERAVYVYRGLKVYCLSNALDQAALPQQYKPEASYY